MFNLGWLEGGLIILAAVLIFGPKRLPGLGSSLAKALRGVREEMQSEDASENTPKDLDS
jgi:sec-independent protein translocase protein TatA